MKRFDLSKRKNTNRKLLGFEEKKHFKRFRQYLQSGVQRDPKYGRFLPYARLNVDQVPLPFISFMDESYEERGTKRVWINQLNPALHKRQRLDNFAFDLRSHHLRIPKMRRTWQTSTRRCSKPNLAKLLSSVARATSHSLSVSVCDSNVIETQ